jgi:hypothetical protein
MSRTVISTVNFKPVIAGTEKLITEAIKKFAPEILQDAKNNTPVRSGRLRDSAEIEITESGFTLTYGVSYGVFIEYGTKYIKPFLALRKARDKCIDEITKYIASRLKQGKIT